MSNQSLNRDRLQRVFPLHFIVTTYASICSSHFNRPMLCIDRCKQKCLEPEWQFQNRWVEMNASAPRSETKSRALNSSLVNWRYQYKRHESMKNEIMTKKQLLALDHVKHKQDISINKTENVQALWCRKSENKYTTWKADVQIST